MTDKHEHDCDCTDLHDHDCDCDHDHEFEDDNIVILIDEEGNEYPFEILFTIEIDEKTYAVLA
ncbi:MAG: DUF1292 domain-containing protein, partial [Bacillota bacterium]